jgi:DNA-binding PadR family transcriptional regulator
VTETKKPIRTNRGNDALEPLTPAVFHIMLALAHGPRHGYALMPEVEKLTNGRLQLGPGTLYRSIQRMLVDGLIEELDYPYDVTSEDERRRYYRLTKLGKQVAHAEAKRLAALVNAAIERGLLPESSSRTIRNARQRKVDGE